MTSSDEDEVLASEQETRLFPVGQHRILLVLGKPESGKTSLSTFILLENADQYAAVVLFGKTSRTKWKENYKSLNLLYCHDQYKPEVVDNLIKLGTEIAKHDPKKRVLLRLDDFSGLINHIFKDKNFESALTTLRHANMDIEVYTHFLTGNVSTNLISVVTDFITFQYAQQNNLQLIWSNWGKNSSQFEDTPEDRQKLYKAIMPKTSKNPEGLDKYEFLKYSVADSKWTKHKTPWPIPEFRLALHPSDLEEANPVYGNNHNYDLSSIENKSARTADAGGEVNPRLFRKEDGAIPVEDEKDGSEREDPKKSKKRKKNKNDEAIEVNGEEGESTEEPPQKKGSMNDRLRPLHQLKKAAKSSLADQVTLIYPGFFDNVDDFDKLSTEELIEMRDKMRAAFAVSKISSSITNQYELLEIGTDVLCHQLFGVNSSMLPNQLREQMDMQIIDALGEADFEAEMTPDNSLWAKFVDMAVPALKAVWQARGVANIQNKFNVIKNRVLPNNVAAAYDKLGEDAVAEDDENTDTE